MGVFEVIAIMVLSPFALYTTIAWAALRSDNARRRRTMRDVLRRHPDLAHASDARLEALVADDRRYRIALQAIAQRERYATLTRGGTVISKLSQQTHSLT